jgi:hypothetical protein
MTLKLEMIDPARLCSELNRELLQTAPQQLSLGTFTDRGHFFSSMFASLSGQVITGRAVAPVYFSFDQTSEDHFSLPSKRVGRLVVEKGTRQYDDFPYEPKIVPYELLHLETRRFYATREVTLPSISFFVDVERLRGEDTIVLDDIVVRDRIEFGARGIPRQVAQQRLRPEYVLRNP